MSLLDKNEITKRHFKQAKQLIRDDKLWDAKQLLKKINHPKAEEWIIKIKKRERYLRMRVIKRIGVLFGVAVLTLCLWAFVHSQGRGGLYREGDISDASFLLNAFCDIYLDKPESTCDRWADTILVNSSDNHGNALIVIECDDNYGWTTDTVSFYDCLLLTYKLPYPD